MMLQMTEPKLRVCIDTYSRMNQSVLELERSTIFETLHGQIYMFFDTFAGDPKEPQSFNKYGFVHGDPVQGIDPSGLSLAGYQAKVLAVGGSIINGLRALGSLYFLGPSALEGVALLGVQALTAWRTLSFGLAGFNSLIFASSAYQADGSIGRKISRGVDDLLAWYPWVVRNQRSTIGISTPEQFLYAYRDTIKTNGIVPPELLGAVLLAEMRHFNAIDSVSDPMSPQTNSIGVAQIRIDTILDQMRKAPSVWPTYFQSMGEADKRETLEAMLWDGEGAIMLLSLTLKSFAVTGFANINTIQDPSLSNDERESLVSRYTSAKDQGALTGEPTPFGTGWGVDAYRYIRSRNIFK